MTARVLYAIVCGSPAAHTVTTLVASAKSRGWEVCVIATPEARKFINEGELILQTGHPIRSSYKRPEEPDILPPPDAIIVAPATFNTINKWAAGIADTLALGLITEGIGKGLPIAAVPALNAAQASHPAFERSVVSLRSWGVTVLYGPDVWVAVEPGEGSRLLASFPWQLALDAVTGTGG